MNECPRCGSTDVEVGGYIDGPMRVTSCGACRWPDGDADLGAAWPGRSC